jgi:hypothetical protein
MNNIPQEIKEEQQLKPFNLLTLFKKIYFFVYPFLNYLFGSKTDWKYYDFSGVYFLICFILIAIL